MMDEQALIARFLKGEESAFRALYALHSPSLYAFVLRLLGRWRSEAEDAMQDAPNTECTIIGEPS